MPTAGPNFPTTATGNTGTIGGGSVTWGNPAFIEAADTSSATAVLAVGAFSDDLIAEGFGFAIPVGATISGILLEVNVKQNIITGAQENSIRLLKAGAAAGTDKSIAANLGASFAVFSYGGSSDLWGTTWTPSDINNASFGAAVSYTNSAGASSRTVSVDFLRITVTYTGVNANVNVTGVSATGSLGTATFKGTANFNATGLSATASLGSAIPTIAVPASGVSATASLGTATFKGTATFAVTGLSSTASLGAVIPTVLSLPTGLSATASIGTATFKGTANFNATGLSATASLGQVRIDAVVSITGVQATGVLGQIIDVLSANVVGVSASALVGSVLVEVRNRMPVVVWIN